MKQIVIVSILTTFSMNGLCIYEDDPGTIAPISNRDYLSEARETLARMGNIYEPEPVSKNAPLSPELVLNNYWRSVQGNLQEEKDAALKTILDINFSSEGYHLERYHYAAAVLIGANFNTVFSKQKEFVLLKSTVYQDNALCQLLFTRGADPNAVSEVHGRLFYLATKVSLAQLFFDVGAQIDSQDCTGLEHSFYCGYEPLLVRWYIEKGVNPLVRTKMGTSPFKNLITFADYHSLEELKEKVDYFFEKLSFEDSKNCIEFALASIRECTQTLKIKWLINNLQNRLKMARIS